MARKLSLAASVVVASFFVALLVIGGPGRQEISAAGPVNPELESIGVPLFHHMSPATNSWPEGRLLYGLAVAGSTNSGPFWVMDLETQQVIFTSSPTLPSKHRMILVDADGNAYFSVNTSGIAKYSPASNSVSILPVSFPSGGWIRSGTRESADGWIYGVTETPQKVFRFNPTTLALEEIADAWGYTTHAVLDPTDRYMYYMGDAHGAAHRKGAPLLQFDVATRQHKVIAFLNTVIEPNQGYRLGGTYALDIDPEGKWVYLNMNASEPGGGGFDKPAFIAVEIPASERPSSVTIPRFSFEEIGSEAGLNGPLNNAYIHTSSWGDVNNDGWPDLFAGTFVQGSAQTPSKLLINDGGHFVPSGQTQLEIDGRGSGSVFADFDNDGDVDLYLSNNAVVGETGASAEPSRLFRNDNGTFVDVTNGSGISAQSSNGRQVGVLDYNNDGLLDIFVVADNLRGPGPTVLLRNNGNFNFSNVTATAGIRTDVHGLGLAIGDVNGDGWSDIFVAGAVNQLAPNSNFMFVSNGNGTFRELASNVFDWSSFTNGNEDWVSGASMADLNRDGRLDIVVGHHFGSSVDTGPGAKIRVYMNRGTLPNGDPDFDDITDAAGLPLIDSKAPHVEIQDFDNDGWPDIYTSLTVSTPDGPMPLIFMHNGNSGDPTFSLASNLSAISNPHYYAGGPTADFNGDGKMDIFLAEWRSVLGTPTPSMLFENQGAPGNWLQVKVEGNTGAGENAMGVGTLIKVYRAGTNTLLGAREISPAFGWSSSQPAIAHFGMGDEKFVDIEMRRPNNGSVTRRNNVPVNRMVIMPDGPTERNAHMGLESTATTITSGAFLNGPGGLPAHTVASTAPKVEFAGFDLPNYPGNPWSSWGGGLFASNGRFYAGVGDHEKVDGNSFVYEYDPITKKLKAVGDINTAAGHIQGEWGHGKIHSQINDGGDGYIYATSYRGSAGGLTFTNNFTGGVVVRYPVGSVTGGNAGSGTPPGPTPTPGPPPTPTPEPTPFPTPQPGQGRVTDGLLALYEFEEGSGSTVNDTSGVGSALDLGIANTNATTWIDGGLRLDSITTVSSSGPASKINSGVPASQEITIEAWIRPSNLTQSGPSRIVSVSQDLFNRNFTLGQEGTEYDTRLRTTASDLSGKPSLRTAGGQVEMALSHVVFTRDANGATTYIDGLPVASRSESGTMTNWNSGYRLALANELTGDRGWVGEMYLVAIYDRALTSDEVILNFVLGEDGSQGSNPGPTPTPVPTATPTPPGPTPTPPPAGEPAIVLADASRANQAPLHGATVSGDIHILISNDSQVDDVEFYLDGPVYHTEFGAPFDFAGGSLAAANPFDSGRLQNGQHNVTARVTMLSGEVRVLGADFTVDNTVDPGPQPTGTGDELLVFDWNQVVTTGHHGFPINQPPMASANGDWTQPIDFANGRFYIRVEIDGQPIPQDMRLQFCVWQNNLTLETCANAAHVEGTPGNVVLADADITTMWKLNGNPIEWHNPRQRYGVAIKNAEGKPVSDYQGWNWNGENPNHWYPLDMRFTVVVVANGGWFDGWSNYVGSAPQPTPTPEPQPTSTPVPQPTSTPVPQPTSTPVPQPTSTPVPQPTSTPVPQPTSTPVPQPTSTPVPQPTSTPVPQPTSTPVPQPTSTPVPQPTSTPVPQPTSTPVPQPTFTPVPQPTATPTPPVVSAPPPPPPPAPTPTPVSVSNPPSAPRDVVAFANDDGSVGVAWFEPASSGGQVILQYRILVIPTGRVIWTDEDETEILIDGLEPGDYRFQVSAENIVGLGSSTLSQQVTVLRPPADGVSEPTPTPAPVPVPTPEPLPTVMPTPQPPLFGAPTDPPPAIEPSPTATTAPEPTRVPTATPRPPQFNAPVDPPRVTAPTLAPPAAEPTPTATAKPVEPTATTAGPGVVQSVQLRRGWNLISFRVLPENADIDAMFAPVSGLYDEIYSMTDDGVKTFKPGRSGVLNSLHSVDPKYGYWIKMREVATLGVTGSPVAEGDAIQLHAGWNMIPYTPGTAMPVSEALSSIAGRYTEVRGFDVEAKSYFPGLPDEFNTLRELHPGMGYLIHVSEATPFSYPSGR